MSLSKNILATVAYYDAFGYPLTSFEVWKHRLSLEGPGGGETDSATLREVLEVLEGESLSRHIAQRSGFYFLKGKDSMVAGRIRGSKISASKLKRIRRLSAILSCVPFVRMIGVTGSLSLRQGDSDSDWDFFVVLRAGRIFTGRTALTGFLHAIGRRRHGAYHRDRACLNYFVTDDALEIGTKDLFSAHEYRFIIPVLGAETFRRFELKNRWIKSFRPNFRITEVLPLWYRDGSEVVNSGRRLLERLLDSDVFEAWLASWQKRKIARNPKTLIPGGHIEACDRALIFLPKPKGPRIFERFMETFGRLQTDR